MRPSTIKRDKKTSRTGGKELLVILVALAQKNLKIKLGKCSRNCGNLLYKTRRNNKYCYHLSVDISLTPQPSTYIKGQTDRTSSGESTPCLRGLKKPLHRRQDRKCKKPEKVTRVFKDNYHQDEK